MAIDRALLDCAEKLGGPCFRHYTWSQKTWSFGYSQHLASVRTLLAKTKGAALVRRPTGGGIVSHENDWTYALILPKQHPLAQTPAKDSYRTIHEAILSSMQAIGIASELAPCKCKKPQKPGVCFEEAVAYDVLELDGSKIAGAAQKRTRSGLLIQGSISQRALENKALLFKSAFMHTLGQTLHCPIEKKNNFPILEDKITSWEKIIASDTWLNLR